MIALNSKLKSLDFTLFDVIFDSLKGVADKISINRTRKKLNLFSKDIDLRIEKYRTMLLNIESSNFSNLSDDLLIMDMFFVFVEDSQDITEIQFQEFKIASNTLLNSGFENLKPELDTIILKYETILTLIVKMKVELSFLDESELELL